MKVVSDELQPASQVGLSGLATTPEVQTQLDGMHRLALKVCPDCRVKLRRDGALIYVPRERAHLPDRARNKNLLTLWPKRQPLGLRVMFPKSPTPGEEAFEAASLAVYESRLRDLYCEVLGLPLKGEKNG